MKIPNLRLLFLAVFAACLPGTTSLLAALPEPLVRYSFEDPAAGTAVASTGTLVAEYAARLNGPAKFGAPGTGPSATSGQTLDLTDSPTMNGSSGGGYSGVVTNQPHHTGLESMTVTGWFNPAVAPIRGARLIRAVGNT
ncbi:MAG: hypothetical protein LBM92_06210, partial [Opitutaceae bacterium]|nr:hypothetical protein [Opitutaceae bacterium]